MKKMVFLDKFYCYGNNIFDEQYLSKTLIQLLKDRIDETGIEGIQLEYIGLYSKENRPMVVIKGSEEEFIYNFLTKEYGKLYDFNELKVGQVVRARMRDPNNVNFGIFLDCGIENPQKDVLLPVYRLREQLVNGKKIPKRQIVRAFGFFENFPLYVEITKIDTANKKIECKIADESIDLLNTWIEDGFEILFSAGMPRKKIKKAIKKKKHFHDYITIERLGFLEMAIFLKNGTNAPGILSDIGPLLSNVRFSMFRPKSVKEMLK
ncbi:MAG: DUF2110 family protein [Promethearchaeota archaeon]